MKIFLALTVLFFGFSFVQAQHEYAPVQEKEISYKDWTYKSVSDNKEVNLRNFANGKKLVMVVYYAPWCPNWKLQIPVAQKLYDKYKADGFEIIGVGEYDTVAAMKLNLEDKKITFPLVYESDSRDAKQKTAHYEYRKASGDTRGWGSPWSVFIEPKKLEKKGDVLLKKTFVVNGELIEEEAEKFIREKLGLPAEVKIAQSASKEKSIEACEPEKNVSNLKKPE